MSVQVRNGVHYLFIHTPIQRYIHPSTEEVDESDAMHHKLVRQRHGHHRNDLDICSARGYIVTIRLQEGQTYRHLQIGYVQRELYYISLRD